MRFVSIPVRRPGRLRPAALVCCAGLALAVASSPARGERPRIYALTGGTVVPSPGRTIEAGTVVIRDGLIESVGAGVAIPADAVEIDAEGRFVYPGLIDAGGFTVGGDGDDDPGGSSGRRSFGGARGAREEGPVHPVSRVRPERLARDDLRPFEGDRKRTAEKYRELGFTAMLAAPESGIFRGRSALVLLHEDRPVTEMILRDDVAQHVALERGRFGQGYPTSLMGAAATIRQTFLDAERHATWSDRYDDDPAGMPRPERLPAFAALRPLLERRQLAIFEVDDPSDVLLADRLSAEFRLDAAILASGSEWEIADRIAATRRTLILPVAEPDKPKVRDEDEALDVSLVELKRWVEAPRGPRTLHEAGVRFAFTLRGLKNQAEFPKLVRQATEAGLPDEVALAALTTVPATLLGVDRVVGTLEAGKAANLIVADGPLFAEKTKLQHVFVDGVEYRIEHKKKPKGDPDAVVDPRGTWSVVFDMFGRTIQRTWTIEGERDNLTGTAETRAGTVTFDRVTLAGNVLTVVFPATENRGTSEVTVIVTGDTFEGNAEFGSRSVEVEGTRTSGPEGGGR